MKFNPRVSIIIPVFNGAEYLRGAIDSALAQTYRRIEVLVVNDGSDDGGLTEEIALSYGDRILYFKKPNGGVASALNMAVRRISGEYWSWLSHDDLYSPDKIESQVKSLAMLNDPRAVLYSDFSVFFDKSDNSRTIRLKDVPPKQFRYFITTENCLHGCTLLIPSSAWAECGPFNEALMTTQDYDLWFRMANCYRFIHVPEVLVRARCHIRQGSVRLRKIAHCEGNALLEYFIDALTEKELTEATRQSVVRSYANLAVNFSARGFGRAAWCAARRTIGELGRNALFDDVVAVVTLARALLFAGPLGILRNIYYGLRHV
jgi:glycosyltransferase involved in cell wall biosynthesis